MLLTIWRLVYEPSTLDDTCMPGDIFSNAADYGVQEHGTDINGSGSEHDSHGEAPSRLTTEKEDMETTGHTDEVITEIKCQLNR